MLASAFVHGWSESWSDTASLFGPADLESCCNICCSFLVWQLQCKCWIIVFKRNVCGLPSPFAGGQDVSARETHPPSARAVLVFHRQCSGDAVAPGDVQGLQPGCSMDRRLRQPAGCCQEVMSCSCGRVGAATLPDASMCCQVSWLFM